MSEQGVKLHTRVHIRQSKVRRSVKLDALSGTWHPSSLHY